MPTLRLLPAVASILLLSAVASAEDSVALRERVDREIERGISGPMAAPATDSEFVRRVYLDLAGRIPPAIEARAFLDDPSPYKRETLIDRLMAAPEFARRMQVAFDLMLMERRPVKNVSAAEWEKFLLDAFAENRPLDAIARDILSADGSDPAKRGPARFYLDRDADPDVLTRDVSRLFLGRDVRCSQCHDHVLYDDYKQSHYFGIFAFFSRTYLATDAAKVVTLGEKAEGDVTFKSVFKKKITNTTGPRVLDAEPLPEPPDAKTAGYLVPPADGARAVPKYSRRARLADELASGKEAAFNRNLANRLWAMVMGRGIVHPLDLHTADNPPSHPELLEMLAQELVERKFDVRSFLRELMLTRTYARSSEPPPGLSPSDAGADRYAVAPLEALNPEAMAWSVMQACGFVESNRAEIERTLFGVDPRFKQLTELDDRRREFGRRLVEQTLHDRLKGNEAPFVSQFGRAAGQPQDANDSTVHQALFLANGDPVNSWVDALAGRLAAITDATALADDLYLSILTRRPSQEERDDLTAYLATKPDARKAAIKDLAWAMFTSSEFRFSH